MFTTQGQNLFAGIDKALNDGLELRAFANTTNLIIVSFLGRYRRNNWRGYGISLNLRDALIRASRDYIGLDNPDDCITELKTVKDSLDNWLLNRNIFSARNQSERVRLEARSYDHGRIIVAVETPSFETAYTTMHKILTP